MQAITLGLEMHQQPPPIALPGLSLCECECECVHVGAMGLTAHTSPSVQALGLLFPCRAARTWCGLQTLVPPCTQCGLLPTDRAPTAGEMRREREGAVLYSNTCKLGTCKMPASGGNWHQETTGCWFALAHRCTQSYITCRR